MTLTAAQKTAADALDAAAAAIRALADEPVVSDRPLAQGDRVRLVGKSIFGTDADGKLGTIRDGAYESDNVTVDVDGEQTRIYSRSQVVRIAPEPARKFEIFDGDTVNFEYLGKNGYDSLTIDINNSTTVWVNPQQLDNLIDYLTAVKAHRAS